MVWEKIVTSLIRVAMKQLMKAAVVLFWIIVMVMGGWVQIDMLFHSIVHFTERKTMPTEYTCPGCGSGVSVPNKAAKIIGFDEVMGCNNVEEHDDGEPLVMWED